MTVHAEMSAGVDRIAKHQKALKLNDSQFVARYQRHLGSTRTWERLQLKCWGEFGSALEKWAGKVKAFCAELDGGSSVDTWFVGLPITKYASFVFQALQGSTTDRRVAWLIGTTGIGKSVNLRRLALDNPSLAVYLRANETWKESKMEIARGLATALGVAEGTSAAATFRNAIEYLKANPLTLCIDEVHEGGVLMIKLIKTLIDETGCKVILGIYPTAWARLVNGSTDATSEAQQLLGRTIKPIDTRWIKGLNQGDVEKYLEAATGLNGDCRQLAARILPELRRVGNLRLLADAIAAARENADDQGNELDADLIEESVRVLSPQNKA